MSTIISIRNLSFLYSLNKVISSVSIDVREGDFFIVIGPNGSGKTTLLKLIGGLEIPETGEISILGQPQADYSKKEMARKLAIVPQYVSIDFPFTVMETVLMGRTPHLGLMGVENKKDYEIAENAMKYTEVEHLSKRRLNQLSGGERQRVTIARALCQQPKIILLDEPTAALDPAHQLKIMDLMERFRREFGITVIMVSHDLNLAALYGNRLLLLKDGRVQKEGSPEDVLTEGELEKGYGCRMLVDTSPVGQERRVNLIPEKYL